MWRQLHRVSKRQRPPSDVWSRWLWLPRPQRLGVFIETKADRRSTNTWHRICQLWKTSRSSGVSRRQCLHLGGWGRRKTGAWRWAHQVIAIFIPPRVQFHLWLLLMSCMYIRILGSDKDFELKHELVPWLWRRCWDWKGVQSVWLSLFQSRELVQLAVNLNWS